MLCILLRSQRRQHGKLRMLLPLLQSRWLHACQQLIGSCSCCCHSVLHKRL
jgi:hypothetical protein